MRFVPAVQMKSSYGAFREVSVRGFYNTVYMVDGVRDERSTINSYPLGDLYNVESIEVLKGPASLSSTATLLPVVSSISPAEYQRRSSPSGHTSVGVA